jgi:D-alanyl-lipoteichoic acid acyltransferase DltB (MBOAT superfamily)
LNLDNIYNILIYDAQNPLYFTTGFFVWFFTFFIALYSAFQKFRNARFATIILFSLYFYYKCSGNFVLLLLAISILNFYLSIPASTAGGYKKKLLLIISLFCNLGTLIYFKYSFFFLSTLGSTIELSNILLPIGISFFIFQNLSYFLDVYKNTIKPANNLIEYLTYSTFFPVIQSGPIMRAGNFIKQINLVPEINREKLGKAVFLLISGLLKKSVISDYISVNFVDRVFENPMLYSGFENLMAVFGYALQIYCDFSGFTDIAMGIALIIGINLPPNFNLPYRSLSIKEFWQRWHMSLSFWFRDYLFLPIAYFTARKLNNKKVVGIKA